MQERKIFNYESVMLSEKTLKEEGYEPTAFGKTSTKFIWATCRFCGEPSRIRKGQFTKSGSACHNECRLKEQSQSKSPFSREDVREKIKQTNLQRYGSENANQNEMVAKKISAGRIAAQDKIEQTNLEKYGVVNPFQSEEIKQIIKQTNQEKYGCDHAMQNDDIKKKTKSTIQERYGVTAITEIPGVKEKAKQTNIARYGYPHPMQNPDLQQSKTDNWNKSIESNDNYNLINTLRGAEFWERMKGDITLKSLCEEFDINYRSTTSRLLHDEFREKYYELYSFPRQQEQKRVASIIRDMGFTVDINDRSIIAPLELDIVIPDKKLAIEFNGSYWHSEACLDHEVARLKHLEKTRMCQNAGYRLFHIFEHQWKERESQILNFLKSILSICDKSVFARKCQLTNDSCREFLDKNHIQGYGNRTIQYFNLIFENRIVGTMTASSHHRQNANDDVVVLNRLCFEDGIQVTGGASKLFSAFTKWAKENNYKSIVSWSDNLWTEGNVYKQLGFIMEQEYAPDYFYWDIKKHIAMSKQSQQKKKVNCPDELTEYDWCKSRGLYRIWDCGKKKWTFKVE